MFSKYASTIRMTYDQYNSKSTYKSIATGVLLGLIPGVAGIAAAAVTSIVMSYYDKGKAQEYDMADGVLDYYLKIDIPGRYITVYNPYP